LTVFLALFFELLGLNGKMGLISQYLKQLEGYLVSLGYEGVIWKAKALEKSCPLFHVQMPLLCPED